MNTDKPEYKKARRPSVSVTDLVAQIAGQIAHEQVQKLEDEVMARLNSFDITRGSQNYTNLRNEIEVLKKEVRTYRTVGIKQAFADRITNSLQRGGYIWPAEEDTQLVDEIRTALDTIAANHGRSAHSIRCRVKDKNIIETIKL